MENVKELLSDFCLKEWKVSGDNCHLKCGQIQPVLIKVKGVHQIRIESVTIKIFPVECRI